MEIINTIKFVIMILYIVAAIFAIAGFQLEKFPYFIATLILLISAIYLEQILSVEIEKIEKDNNQINLEEYKKEIERLQEGIKYKIC